MSAFYRAALLRLALFVLVFTVIVTVSKGSLPPSARALALPAGCELAVFCLQRRTLARSWTASRHYAWPQGEVSRHPFSVGAAVAWAGLTLLDDGRWGWALVSFAGALMTSFLITPLIRPLIHPLITPLIRPLIRPYRVRRAQRYARAHHAPAGLE
ncbi:hypothetical protein GCM10011579_032330 [Streptomyces albiflavescens]|uniref:Uncharacterized protein n=1 Tax=Streptomyces albiflavescens TaxID=1623582 RepID=A0A917Y3J3_9ACTN|nr:hypothetical protein GCM10011579_032330 [Streptomyces albiflavescens]